MSIVCNNVNRRKRPSVPGNGSFTYTKALWYADFNMTLQHPIPGYVGPVDILMCGSSSQQGNYWSSDSKGGTTGSGQGCVATYQMLGDETYFTLSQVEAGTTNGRLVLTVNGGANNGKRLAVGSSMPSGGYGAAGAATNWATASFSDLPRTNKFMGSHRSYDTNISYSDNTTYPPQGPASYGAAKTRFTYFYGGRVVDMFGSTGPGGVHILSGTGDLLQTFGFSPVTYPENWGAGPVEGGIIFAFPD